MRMLCYGSSADSLDEAVEISETVTLKSLRIFVRSVITLFGDEYLRLPSDEDVQRLLEENGNRGFPGMLRSVDCMKWCWKNCPSAWKGAFQGREKKPTVVLEAIASYDLHIWHAFIGVPGSGNDINVLDASPLMQEYCDTEAPQFLYKVNGNRYKFLYWLADGIYPNWRCFMKTISAPIGEQQAFYAASQEAVRKDIERAFGVLQARFAIVARPCLFWELDYINKVMKCCIILHNMIIADDKVTGRMETGSRFAYMHGYNSSNHHAEFVRLDPSADELPSSFVERSAMTMDTSDHFRLKRDLVEHIWDFNH